MYINTNIFYIYRNNHQQFYIYHILRIYIHFFLIRFSKKRKENQKKTKRESPFTIDDDKNRKKKDFFFTRKKLYVQENSRRSITLRAEDNFFFSNPPHQPVKNNFTCESGNIFKFLFLIFTPMIFFSSYIFQTKERQCCVFLSSHNRIDRDSIFCDYYFFLRLKFEFIEIYS